MSFRYQNGMLLGAFALWSIAVATGTAMMWNYANKAGNEGKASLSWPNESQIPRSRKHPTLVMFAHPRCPCTRASIGELAVLMARCHGKVDAEVLFFKPTGSSENWARTDQGARSAMFSQRDLNALKQALLGSLDRGPRASAP